MQVCLWVFVYGAMAAASQTLASTQVTDRRGHDVTDVSKAHVSFPLSLSLSLLRLVCPYSELATPHGARVPKVASVINDAFEGG